MIRLFVTDVISNHGSLPPASFDYVVLEVGTASTLESVAEFEPQIVFRLHSGDMNVYPPSAVAVTVTLYVSLIYL